MTFNLCYISAAHAIDDGTYSFTIAFSEWGGKSLGTTCDVIIKGKSISVMHDGTGNLSGKKGDIILEGILMEHKKTEKLIIGNSKKDELAEEIGACTGGPSLIDLENRIVELC